MEAASFAAKPVRAPLHNPMMGAMAGPAGAGAGVDVVHPVHYDHLDGSGGSRGEDLQWADQQRQRQR
eukprot:CAMPEP_0198700828 /NCGR_PEP_ID=MMETSP1468-20131203/375376_1 /TAXON_ID=1461545 /ORGANISM="Mantoniella sp, Strain CCMP1436" /LENGTH=66 /DNA_ID=CAMNT_0044458919 /DNA_START=13 /DNA_END=213 /DNA_ORIENTATION=+